MIRRLLLMAALAVGGVLLGTHQAKADCPFGTLGATYGGTQGCLVMGSGTNGAVPVTVSGGSSTVTFPYGSGTQQTATANSFVGMVGVDAGGKVNGILTDTTGRVILAPLTASSIVTLGAGSAVIGVVNQGTSPWVVTTPAPAPTNAAGTAINVSGVQGSNASAPVLNESACGQTGTVCLDYHTAGVASTNLVGIQGNASGVPVPVSGTVTLGAGAAAIGSITNTAFGITGAIPTGANVIGSIANAGFNATVSNGGTLASDASNRPVVVGAGVAGTPAGGVVSVQGVSSGTVLPVSGTVTIGNASIPVTQSGTWNVGQTGSPWGMNLTQVGGAAVALGSAVSASSLPVVVASDQAAVAVKYGSGTFASNVSQINGATLSLGSTTGANSLPVVIASDQGAFPVNATLQTGTNSIGNVNTSNANPGFWRLLDGTSTTVATVFASNSDARTNVSTNLATETFLYGFNGTSWDRIRSAKDISTGIPASAANSQGPTAVIACDKSAPINISTATTTSLVAVSGSTVPYVCSFSVYVVSGTLPSFQFEQGTGAACTSPTVLTGTYGGLAGAVGEHITLGANTGTVFRGPASSGICILSGGTAPNLQGVITYAQF
jgi:hypothetical protein